MGHDLDSDVTPIQAGLDFAVKKKGDFVGAEALAHAHAHKLATRMVSILLDDPNAHPLGDEPVYVKNTLVGQATSAAFGYRIKRPLALAYLDADLDDGSVVELDIAGERASGVISLRPAFDPDGLRMREKI